MNKSVCLNMIIKNESKVIRRCLDSVKHLINSWIIVDTGSSDGTQKIVREHLRDIPGVLHKRPWVDFSYNRNEALALAKGQGDYLLFIDADEVLTGLSALPFLDLDCYYAICRAGSSDTRRLFLIDNKLSWQWSGVLHETIGSSDAKTGAFLAGALILATALDGHRTQDPQKWLKDARLLEKAPKNGRNLFHLACAYTEGKQFAKALQFYEERILMGESDDEVYESLYRIAILQELLQFPAQQVLKNFERAYFYRPSRAEPLYALANAHIQAKRFLLGYVTSQFALTIPRPADSYFTQSWIYEYGLLYQFAQCAYQVGKTAETLEAFEKLLTVESLPQEHRKLIEQNLTLSIFNKRNIS